MSLPDKHVENETVEDDANTSKNMMKRPSYRERMLTVSFLSYIGTNNYVEYYC